MGENQTEPSRVPVVVSKARNYHKAWKFTMYTHTNSSFTTYRAAAQVG